MAIVNWFTGNLSTGSQADFGALFKALPILNKVLKNMNKKREIETC